MKTRNLVALTGFALLLGLVNSVNNNSVVKAEAAGNEEQVIYSVDFEKYVEGTVGDTIYQDRVLWTENAHVNASVINNDGDKMYKYEVIGDDGYGYTQFGGIGVGADGNLRRLEDGATYTISMYIDATKAAENSVFFLEYKTLSYTCVKVFPNGTAASDSPSTTHNLSYVNNVLSFTFTANKLSSAENSYFKLVGQNMAKGDNLTIDDIKIVKNLKETVLTNDFEAYEVGAASTGSASDIANVWNDGNAHANYDTLAIAEENGNKYLHAYEAGDGSQKWTNFYFNGLPLVGGEKYRLSFDLLEHNFIEIYAVHHESGAHTATYRPTGYVGGNSDYVLGGSFDGTHLTFDFIADNTKGNWWNQVHIISYHTGNLELKIDNFKLERLIGEEVTFKTATELGFSADYTLEGENYNFTSFSDYSMRFSTTVADVNVASILVNHETAADLTYGALIVPTAKLEGKTFEEIYNDNNNVNFVEAYTAKDIPLTYNATSMGVILNNIPSETVSVSAVIYVIAADGTYYFANQTDISVKGLVEQYKAQIDTLNLDAVQVKAVEALYDHLNPVA